MPEILNVTTGETIASSWGNQIRDRTIQRYASAAERASAHPSPTQGDLSYLVDVGQVQVFRSGTGWTHVGAGLEVDGHNQVDGSLSLTTSFANAASVSLSIPTDWASWECAAWGRLRTSSQIGAVETRIVIDGTAGQVDTIGTAGLVVVGARRTGITTTGSRTVTLQARRVGDSGSASLRYLQARAVRTS